MRWRESEVVGKGNFKRKEVLPVTSGLPGPGHGTGHHLQREKCRRTVWYSWGWGKIIAVNLWKSSKGVTLWGSPQQHMKPPVWSLALDMEGRRVPSRKEPVPCCAGKNPLLTQTFLLQGCTQPAVGRPGTPHAAVLGGSKREEKLRERNLSESGGLSQ